MDRNKESYKKSIENCKPSRELLDRTSKLMKAEIEKKNSSAGSGIKKKPALMVVAASLVVALGLGIHVSNNIWKKEKDKVSIDDRNKVPMSKEEVPNMKTKVSINLVGKVQEVKDQGKMIKINDQWIKITEKTGFNTPNGERNVSTEFKIGNEVEGFTVEENGVKKALVIYKNK